MLQSLRPLATTLVLFLLAASCVSLRTLEPGESYDPVLLRWGYGALAPGMNFREYTLYPDGKAVGEIAGGLALIPVRYEGHWEATALGVKVRFDKKITRIPEGEYDPEAFNTWGGLGEHEAYVEDSEDYRGGFDLPLWVLEAWAPDWFANPSENRFTKSDFLIALELTEKKAYWFEPQPAF
jgi:hypothetical protein